MVSLQPNLPYHIQELHGKFTTKFAMSHTGTAW